MKNRNFPQFKTMRTLGKNEEIEIDVRHQKVNERE
jgi:hypothetical protein